MKIIQEGENDEVSFEKEENELCCPHCNCKFSFREGNIDIVTEPIKYKKGIKKILGFNKGYYIRKYITCPWCKSIFKLKYVIDN